MENKSRTYNSAKNIFFGFANKFLSMILNFVGRALFVRIFVEEYLGINGLFGDVLMMLSLADLGFSTAMSYSFYKPLAERDERKLAALITFYKRIYNYIAISVACVGVALVPVLKYIVNVEKPIPNLQIYYLATLLNTVVSYLFIYKSSIVSADQKGHEIAKYGMWTNVGKLVGQIGILYLTKSYLLYLLVVVVSTLINNLMISIKADKMYPFIKEKIQLEIGEKKEIFENMKSIFLYKFASVLLTGTDNLIISIIVGTVYVGRYGNYNMITGSLLSIVSIMFGSLTASLGNLIVKEVAEKRYEIFKIMQMISFWLCGVATVTMFFLSNDFISIWLGKKYLLDDWALIAIALNFYLALTLHPIWSFREATGLYTKTKYIMVVTAAVNLILSIVLGSYFGVAGVIGATFISKVSTYFWYEPKILFQDFFERKVFTYYVDHLINLVLTGISGICAFFLLPKFLIDSYFEWIIKAFVCFVIVNVLFLIRYFRTNEFKLMLGKVLRK